DVPRPRADADVAGGQPHGRLAARSSRSHAPGRIIAERKEADAMPARTPEDCDRLFAEHVNAGDLEALLALYEPGCSLVRADDGEHGALEVAPPDGRVQPPARLPDGRRDVPEGREPVVLEERGERIAPNAVRGQRGVIALDQPALQPAAALGIPVQRNHIREI